MLKKNAKWLVLFAITVLVACLGLIFGQHKGKSNISKMYERRDFILLDMQGNYFQLSKSPSDRFFLILLTPDAIVPSDVPAFSAISQKVARFKGMNVDVFLLSRTNREIVKNFGLAAKFPGKILLDPSGSVGHLLGIWPEKSPADFWGYALIDRGFRVIWSMRKKEVLSPDEIWNSIKPLLPHAKEAASK